MDYIDMFAESMKTQRKLSDTTIECYMRDIRKFNKFASDNSLAFDKAADEFVKQLNRDNIPTSSKARYLCSLRAYADYLVSIGFATSNPFSDIVPEKITRKIPQVLSVAQMRTLLSQPDVTKPDGLRDRVALELAYQSGLKINELIALNVEDVNLITNTLTQKHGSFERIIPVIAPLNAFLNEYLTVRLEILKGRSEKALLLNMRGGRLTRQGFHNIVVKYAKALDFCDGISAQTMRMSLAAHMIESGADTRELREAHALSQNAARALYNTINDSN